MTLLRCLILANCEFDFDTPALQDSGGSTATKPHSSMYSYHTLKFAGLKGRMIVMLLLTINGDGRIQS